MKKEERLKIITPVQEIEKFLPHVKSIFGAREILHIPKVQLY